LSLLIIAKIFFNLGCTIFHIMFGERIIEILNHNLSNA
jgi:hypothetical protein